ncbi:hypothetical protein [Dyella silvatica]|uniref:hypothetical protein n=1 Tax=Dyella silvatica TaxID=2992128 RepID=UPI0022597D40|nr:hypothetical protein [Dyella silvatica]
MKLNSSTGNDELCAALGKVQAKDAHGTVKLDPKIISQIRQSDEFFTLDAFPAPSSGKDSVIFVRVPSVPEAAGQGYCGAGHEDYMLLVEKQDRSLRLLDRLLIQSCLKNINLASDQSDNPRLAVKAGVAPVIASFDLMSADDVPAKTKQVVLKDRKLLLIDAAHP